jgi:hypothetical protein
VPAHPVEKHLRTAALAAFEEGLTQMDETPYPIRCPLLRYPAAGDTAMLVVPEGTKAGPRAGLTSGPRRSLVAVTCHRPISVSRAMDYF